MVGIILGYAFLYFMMFVLLAVAVEGVLQMIDKDRRRREVKNAKR
jgi:hypothetical protein